MEGEAGMWGVVREVFAILKTQPKKVNVKITLVES